MFKDNEAKSGGAGADISEGGELADAKHAYEFMGGRLATMLWEDLMEQLAGGDDGGIAETIIPDGKAGSASSIKGGPGVRGTTAKLRPDASAGATSSTTVKTEGKLGPDGAARATARTSANKKKKSNGDASEDLHRKMADAIAKISAVSENELQRTAVDPASAKSASYESLADDVDRLSTKVDTAKSEGARSLFRALLADKEAELEIAMAEIQAEKEKKLARERQAAAGSAAAATAQTAEVAPVAVDTDAGTGAPAQALAPTE